MPAGERNGQVLVETYRIERLIAEGGMGSVYEARHLRLPKRFAVKFLNVSLLDNDEAQARFRREAEIIAALDHPNIVNLLDYNVTEDGVPFIVLEFLDGEHLGKRINQGALPLDETLRILAPVTSALGAAHARGVIHRDLKPENIVLCKDDVVKVVDFGIAKIRDGQELTAMNTILGTVPYMAPEQLFGTEVTVRADQFALAAIVYEMLTTEMAFGGPLSVPEVAARVAHHQPPDVKGVPPAVNAALFQAMAKDAAARFPSVKEFLLAMQEAARKGDEPAVSPDALAALAGLDEGLPPLAGEATVVNSVAPGAPASIALPRPAATMTPPGSDLMSLGADTGASPISQVVARVEEPTPTPVRDRPSDATMRRLATTGPSAVVDATAPAPLPAVDTSPMIAENTAVSRGVPRPLRIALFALFALFVGALLWAL